MAEQIKPEDFFAEIKQKIEAYINDRVLLFKLQSTKKVSKLISGLLVGLIVFFLLIFVLLFLSIAAGFYFSTLTHSAFYGFGIVAVIYLLLFFVIIKFRKPLIERPIVALIIKLLFD
jgi:Protein of unknown function (DUF1469).